jgi:hypothetical protein
LHLAGREKVDEEIEVLEPATKDISPTNSSFGAMLARSLLGKK